MNDLRLDISTCNLSCMETITKSEISKAIRKTANANKTRVSFSVGMIGTSEGYEIATTYRADMVLLQWNTAGSTGSLTREQSTAKGFKFLADAVEALVAAGYTIEIRNQFEIAVTK